MIPIWGVLGHVKSSLFVLLLVIGTKICDFFHHLTCGDKPIKCPVCPKESVLDVNRRVCQRACLVLASKGRCLRQGKAEPACAMVGAGALILSAVTTLSCEIHANIFRITETQKPSAEKISGHPTHSRQSRVVPSHV